MPFDSDKAFEMLNGVTLGEDGTGVFGGTGTPVGQAAPIRSYYYAADTGLMWYKYGALDSEWREVRPEYVQDHIILFTSNGTGQGFNKNNWERLALGHINGTDIEPPNMDHEFQVICSQAGNSSVDVRLYDVTNDVVLVGPINFTELVPTYKSATYTPPAGNPVVEVQGMKSGNSQGELFWCSAESIRTEL